MALVHEITSPRDDVVLTFPRWACWRGDTIELRSAEEILSLAAPPAVSSSFKPQFSHG